MFDDYGSMVEGEDEVERLDCDKVLFDVTKCLHLANIKTLETMWYPPLRQVNSKHFK